MKMMFQEEQWKKWKLIKKESFIVLFPFLFSTPRGNFCFKEGQWISITLADYGQILVAAIRSRKKICRNQHINVCTKKWAFPVLLKRFFILSTKPNWIMN